MICVTVSLYKRMISIPTATYVFDECLLYAALHHAGGGDAVLTMEVAADDRRTYISRGVDDFLNSRNTLCDAHAGHTSKMKSFQSHLRSRFAD